MVTYEATFLTADNRWDAVRIGIDIGEAEESVEERRAATARLAAAELGAVAGSALPLSRDADLDRYRTGPTRWALVIPYNIRG